MSPLVFHSPAYIFPKIENPANILIFPKISNTLCSPPNKPDTSKISKILLLIFPLVRVFFLLLCTWHSRKSQIKRENRSPALIPSSPLRLTLCASSLWRKARVPTDRVWRPVFGAIVDRCDLTVPASRRSVILCLSCDSSIVRHWRRWSSKFDRSNSRSGAEGRSIR